jgi:hypothetical protein
MPSLFGIRNDGPQVEPLIRSSIDGVAMINAHKAFRGNRGIAHKLIKTAAEDVYTENLGEGEWMV